VFSISSWGGLARQSPTVETGLARYSTIVQYQLLYHHHRSSQGGTWAMGPKIYHFHKMPPFCQFYKKVVLRLSERGDVIEAQTKQTRSLVVGINTR